MPKELIKPRVYAEKILPKHFFKKPDGFLYPKSETKVLNYVIQAYFKEIFHLYKLFAQKTSFKTQKQLKDDIISFSRSRNIKTGTLTTQKSIISVDKTTVDQFLFSQNDFVSYLVSHAFSRQKAQDFWELIYNKDRFTLPQKSQSNLPVVKNDFISMKAFVYNFKKFYLQEEEYYKNTFSEAAFRQRMIDLRLILEPWFSRNIVLKSKLKKWKKNELETAQFLKLSGFDKENSLMLKMIEERNRLYFLMRTVSKSIFDLTDQKNFGMDVWNERVTFLIEQKSDSLICFMQFMDKFKELLIQQELSNPKPDEDKSFKITDLLEYLEKNRHSYEQLEQKWLVKWVRNIYKYLYHYKEHDQIYLDPISYKLCLKSPIRIQPEMVSEFVRYKSMETDNILDVLNNFTEEIDEKLAEMPELQGKKKYLVECNYVVQTLLRIIKRNNFACFEILYEINKIVELYGFDFENCSQQIIDFLRASYEKSLMYSPTDKFWKEIFTPENIQQEKPEFSQSHQPYTYKDAIEKYNNVKSALGIAKSSSNLNQFQVNNTNKQQRPKPADKKVKNLPKKAGDFLQKMTKENVEANQKIQEFDWDLKYKRNHHEHNCQGYCLHCEDVISTEVSSTIGRVEDMESYLMDLLRDV